jgi:hypothetical protein
MNLQVETSFEDSTPGDAITADMLRDMRGSEYDRPSGLFQNDGGDILLSDGTKSGLALLSGEYVYTDLDSIISYSPFTRMAPGTVISIRQIDPNSD